MKKTEGNMGFYKKTRRIGFGLLLGFMMCFLENNAVMAEETETREQRIVKALEEEYGWADNPVYGKYVAHVEYGNSIVNTYKEGFQENSHGGIVFLKNLTDLGKTEGIVCVYLNDNENGEKIALKVKYTNSDSPGGYIYTFGWDRYLLKDFCYIIIGSEYFASVEIQEKTLADEIRYNEAISIYKLARNDTKRVCTITRIYVPRTKSLKDYQICEDSNQIIYAEGYTSYTAPQAEFASSEQEFYDRVNTILNETSMDCIHLNPITWENRWDAVKIDQNGTENDVVKAEFSYSEPVTDENGDEVTEVTIRLNGGEEKENGE